MAHSHIDPRSLCLSSIIHMVNIDVLANVGALSVDTQLPTSSGEFSAGLAKSAHIKVK